MYQAQHQHLISVLNIIFAVKHREDIIKSGEEVEGGGCSPSSSSTSCQDASTKDNASTEEESCEDKGNTADADEMYKARHRHLISVLNLIFAFKRQEDIKRLEEDKATAIQRCWRRRRSRSALKQEEDKVSKLARGRLTAACPARAKQEYQVEKGEIVSTKECSTVCTVDESDYEEEDSECIDMINNDIDEQFRLHWRRVGHRWGVF